MDFLPVTSLDWDSGKILVTVIKKLKYRKNGEKIIIGTKPFICHSDPQTSSIHQATKSDITTEFIDPLKLPTNYKFCGHTQCCQIISDFNLAYERHKNKNFNNIHITHTDLLGEMKVLESQIQSLKLELESKNLIIIQQKNKINIKNKELVKLYQDLKNKDQENNDLIVQEIIKNIV